MKARDVVAGWPQGTSTSKPWPCEGFRTMGVFYTSVYDVHALADDFVRDREYHEDQDRMMHEYRTQTGRFELRRNHFKLVGFSAKP